MYYKLMVWLLCIVGIFNYSTACSQTQACPANVNFATGDLSFWSAKTGLLNGASQNFPAPNSGVSTIQEYNISTNGIKVITSSSTDPFGKFPTIPTINGYSYNYSVQLGSTATSYDLRANIPNPGGFSRSITYNINVPAGSTSEPYTMTYAYAMVLENGTHNSNEQPMFKATLSVSGNVIDCASPKYYLPTLDNATNNNGGNGSGTGATLDTAKALANGFYLSDLPFLSHAGTQNNAGTLLYDVWTKGWTEVTFDLAPYRGQQVNLTFEADNCLPGAHFAYAYVALRNTCAGLEISGNTKACANVTTTYSVPALAGATYSWTVPQGWTINSGSNTNIIKVTPGTTSGNISVREVNGCADLKDVFPVSVTPPTVAGQVLSNSSVCTGTNTTQLALNGSVGNILKWLYSTDGNQWNAISNTGTNYTAQNLTSTTMYKAIVQNGSECNVDTSKAASIIVDPKSVGGTLSPDNTNICIGQTSNSKFQLKGNTGGVANWQQSFDQLNWTNFLPVKTDSTFNTNRISSDIYYRVIVKSGVCPADTSSVASVHLLNAEFPSVAINPDSVFICYGKTAPLNVTINKGASYTWSPAGTLTNQGNGNISSLPFHIQATASPISTTNYILTVYNNGCPNALIDTFHVNVAPRVQVFAGNDTMIVANQPLQLNATINNPSAYQFTWSPAMGLSSTTVQNPIATLNSSIEAGSITYIVRATNAIGCYSEDNISVKVFKTGPEIFVPSGFTPNGDTHNDVIRPILVGIKQLNFFRIYNRWGQLIFSTSEGGKGWDGRVSGQEQPTGNFVYMVQGIDYTGRIISKKGNVVLIR
ncbi:gliding motility-associated C-terminal domain-containing protein [Chitinophagaceae bacterium LB-8]|uniref:Gliding motility-associated C-terminal domain-containing protein n=1 Tax=Paraflavisolibacter caeni TaxID=2982496 RepID=A0A9X2XX61_9BACT|nr:T9SS type B sorting domain-containing protein [Paraflavisolibacter caeni]MCU7550710.1 gliding motility-associated C-terminal domain-containing protein [Paraflavisolibacter caeni]